MQAKDECKGRLRSRNWFDNPANPGMTSIYLERFPNYGLTREEMQSGKPIIGIAQTGSDISACNRHFLTLVDRIRDGIRDAGGIPFVFPTHPIQESCRRPTAAIDRNLFYLGLVEILHGTPMDGVVLTTGCDKTTPASLMAVATVNIPAIVLSGGPMLNSYYNGKLAGSGMAAREGATSTTSETSKAPSPNQTIKNAGTASSAMISPIPSTAQCHHSGCIPASMFICPVPPDAF